MLEEIERMKEARKVLKPRLMHKKKFTADEWLTKNLEYLVDNFAGGYVVLVDDKGLLYTNKDGTPLQITQCAKKEFPKTPPLFFRVPHHEDFICALSVR